MSRYQKKHSPTTIIVVINHPYLLSPSTMTHGILRIQSTCSTVFFHNLSPSFLWSTSWPGTLHFILHTFLHPIIVFFSHAHTIATCSAVVLRLCPLIPVSLSTLYLELFLEIYIYIQGNIHCTLTLKGTLITLPHVAVLYIRAKNKIHYNVFKNIIQRIKYVKIWVFFLNDKIILSGRTMRGW